MNKDKLCFWKEKCHSSKQKHGPRQIQYHLLLCNNNPLVSTRLKPWDDTWCWYPHGKCKKATSVGAATTGVNRKHTVSNQKQSTSTTVITSQNKTDKFEKDKYLQSTETDAITKPVPGRPNQPSEWYQVRQTSLITVPPAATDTSTQAST